MNRTEQLAVFHHSLDRATAEHDFLDRFYSSFMAGSPKIQQVFRHTDMASLKRKLTSSLQMMTLAVDDAPGAEDYLRYLGRSHRRFDLNSTHFDLWKGSLLKTVAQCDPEFDDEIQAVWAEVIGSGIALIRAGMNGSS